MDAVASNGIYDIEVVVSDRSGNMITNTASLEVNKTEVGASIELLGTTANVTRGCTFLLTDGSGSVVEARVESVAFVGGLGSYTLTQVPASVVAVSANTDLDIAHERVASF